MEIKDLRKSCPAHMEHGRSGEGSFRQLVVRLERSRRFFETFLLLKGPFTLLHFLRASASDSCISAGRQKISYLCIDAVVRLEHSRRFFNLF